MAERLDETDVLDDTGEGADPEPVVDAPTAPLPTGDDGPHAGDIDQRRAGIAVIVALASGKIKSNSDK
jgi:hypothetical protein